MDDRSLIYGPFLAFAGLFRRSKGLTVAALLLAPITVPLALLAEACEEDPRPIEEECEFFMQDGVTGGDRELVISVIPECAAHI